MNEHGMEIDLHFDALDSIDHKSNHDQPWAYEGGRINEEMRRLLHCIEGETHLKEIYHPQDDIVRPCVEPPKKKRGVFDIIFRPR